MITTTPPSITYAHEAVYDGQATVDEGGLWYGSEQAEVLDDLAIEHFTKATKFSQAAASDRGTDDPGINAAWVAAMAEVALSCDPSAPDGVRLL